MDWLKTPPLYALKAFESAARYQSFTLAAEELSISQSAVSKHIQTIEGFFGRRLFDRNGPKVVLTSDGMDFAKEVHEAFQSLCYACAQFSNTEEILKVSAPVTFSLRWFIAVLRKLDADENYPRIILDSQRVGADCIDIKDLKKEGFDGIVQYLHRDESSDNQEKTLLLEEWIIPVCSPSLLIQYTRSSRVGIDLLGYKSPDDKLMFWNKIVPADIYLTPINCQDFNSMDLAISAALQGLGIAIVDVNMVKKELKNGTLVLPFKYAIKTGYGYYFSWLRSNLQCEKLIALNRFLKKEILEERLPFIQYVDK
ncbi:LysR family transcriptional regulator [Lonsdalea quercina]|uniref:LysR family transcriptional regulator n=1 Tax=Lonsdalea quercina TaxID=71657 RepID=UPI0039762E36